jgi:hypothetical protein
MSDMIFLGDEGQKIGIESMESLPGDKRVFDDVPYFLTNHGPTKVK